MHDLFSLYLQKLVEKLGGGGAYIVEGTSQKLQGDKNEGVVGRFVGMTPF